MDSGKNRIALVWLIGASLFFYGWWNPAYLWLISCSILFNYFLGSRLFGRPKGKKTYLALLCGIVINISFLGYFKYANFFVDNINSITGTDFHLNKIILPLAISFFTFQQISFLVSAYRDEMKKCSFIDYTLFVTFFPQLIAGPIVFHEELLPQFVDAEIKRSNRKQLAIGLTFFFGGLFKKSVLADGISVYVTPAFDAVATGTTLTFFEAWGASLSYTFQIYFDFSGYSDMAIGLAYMFGFCLPLNFYSPYKASNIIEFWRRWHITLSRFLRTYLYIPLGGNRKGEFARYRNLQITMLLGGLWHGAGLTLILWGGLHGVYLIINHFWHKVVEYFGYEEVCSSWFGRWMARSITLIAVIIAWVFFRADNISSALQMIKAMSGANGFALPINWLYKFGLIGIKLEEMGCQFGNVPFLFGVKEVAALGTLLLIVLFMPNIHDFMGEYSPALNTYNGKDQNCFKNHIEWQPTLKWAIYFSIVVSFAVLSLTHVSEFLYFQF